MGGIERSYFGSCDSSRAIAACFGSTDEGGPDAELGGLETPFTRGFGGKVKPFTLGANGFGATGGVTFPNDVVSAAEVSSSFSATKVSRSFDGSLGADDFTPSVVDLEPKIDVEKVCVCVDGGA